MGDREPSGSQDKEVGFLKPWVRKRVVNFGLIGGGEVAWHHMAALRKHPRARILWLADVNGQVLARRGRQFRVPRLTRNFRDMLKDPDLDAVVVCTPPFLHRRMALEVMRAGKHLLLEKPMATTIGEARAILKESRKHRRLLVSDCSARFARLNPRFGIVRDMIRGGRLGRVYHIHHQTASHQGRIGIEMQLQSGWFLDRSKAGGGPLMDDGVYDLSFHLGVVGDPRFLDAQAFCRNRMDRKRPSTRVFDVEEHAGAWMRFAGGLTYYWERAINAHNPAPSRTRIYGTRGGLQFTYSAYGGMDGKQAELKFYYVTREGRGRAASKTLWVDLSRRGDGYGELDRAFVNALVSGGPPPMPLELALKNLKIIQSIYRAARW